MSLDHISEKDARMILGWLYRFMFLGILLGALGALLLALLLHLDFT